VALSTERSIGGIALSLSVSGSELTTRNICPLWRSASRAACRGDDHPHRCKRRQRCPRCARRVPRGLPTASKPARRSSLQRSRRS